jgi:hypothetical protein
MMSTMRRLRVGINRSQPVWAASNRRRAAVEVDVADAEADEAAEVEVDEAVEVDADEGVEVVDAEEDDKGDAHSLDFASSLVFATLCIGLAHIHTLRSSVQLIHRLCQ